MPNLQISSTVVRHSHAMDPSENISEPCSSRVAADSGLNEPANAAPLPSKTINGVRAKRGARAKREQSKLSLSRAKFQGSTGRLLASSSHNDAFEGQDSGTDKPHRGPFSSEMWLACPFFKHDPAKYCRLRACQTPGWPSMGRVKEHIMRRHKEDMTTPQIDYLQSRSKYSSKSDEERWMEVFHILFPEAQIPPTPYCSDPSHERIASINREVLKLLNERLSQDSMFNSSPMLMQRIPEIVDGCMTSAMEKYQNPQLSYQTPPNRDQSIMELDSGYGSLRSLSSLPSLPTIFTTGAPGGDWSTSLPANVYGLQDFWEPETNYLPSSTSSWEGLGFP